MSVNSRSPRVVITLAVIFVLIFVWVRIPCVWFLEHQRSINMYEPSSRCNLCSTYCSNINGSIEFITLKHRHQSAWQGLQGWVIMGGLKIPQSFPKLPPLADLTPSDDCQSVRPNQSMHSVQREASKVDWGLTDPKEDLILQKATSLAGFFVVIKSR